MCAAGLRSRIERRIKAVVHDLPVPVVPRIAKCLPSRSSTRIIAGIDPDFDGTIDRPEALAMVFQEPTLLPWRSTIQPARTVTAVPPAAQ